MRYLTILVAAAALAACGTTPDTRSGSSAETPAGERAPDLQRASLDSVVQFLLTAAATDFHAHRPPDPARFRDVRLGHVPTPDGGVQYRMCGEFLPAEGGADAEWTPFATIKTSGYEQWLGATGFCQDPAITWDDVGDLSSSLQARLDSLR